MFLFFGSPEKSTVTQISVFASNTFQIIPIHDFFTVVTVVTGKVLFSSEGDNWSEVAVDVFEDLCHVAQWKPLMAKVVSCGGDNRSMIGGSTVPQVALYDTSGTEVSVKTQCSPRIVIVIVTVRSWMLFPLSQVNTLVR